MNTKCTHLNLIHEVTPSADGCEECCAVKDTWVHLRICQTCGYVGCCDSSKNKHATKHFHATTHPVVKSFEPGEDWFWDYRARSYVDGPDLAPPEAHPPSQPAPGPEGRVPAGWQQQLHR